MAMAIRVLYLKIALKCETFCLCIPGSLFRKPKWHVVVVLNVANEFIIFLNNCSINPMNMCELFLFFVTLNKNRLSNLFKPSELDLYTFEFLFEFSFHELVSLQ